MFGDDGFFFVFRSNRVTGVYEFSLCYVVDAGSLGRRVFCFFWLMGMGGVFCWELGS